MHTRLRGAPAIVGIFVVLLVAASFNLFAANASVSPHVLRVCAGTGCPSNTQFRSIQAAVDAAAPGDWVLVWPGDYHEKATARAGVSVTKPGIHIRGLDRNLVVVDGTLPGAPRPCSSDPRYQDLHGRNGIEVTKVGDTSIENLTVCNYLTGSGGGAGNEIWWNNGDGSGKASPMSFTGDYLSATSTFYTPNSNGSYGIFTSNSDGPGVIDHSYASNMSDSSYYIGACADCNQVLIHAHGENSALGFSGTNAGGNLVIRDSEFNLNKSGIVPNSLNNDDAPPPQNGACPAGTKGPLGTGSCTIIESNHVHDNNNPNVPTHGVTGTAPIGSGIELSGTSNITVINNDVENQGAWGIVVHDYPDTETPPPTSNCQGGVSISTPPQTVCDFLAKGNVVTKNYLQHNGFFGNPTNGDLGNQSTSTPRNCFSGNVDQPNLTSAPPRIETVDGAPCTLPGVGDPVLAAELVCASGLVAQCGLPGASYPQTTQVQLIPLRAQATMPRPCAGLPSTPWCPYRGPASAGESASNPLAVTATQNATWQGAVYTNAATPAPEACTAATPCDTVYTQVALGHDYWINHPAGAVQFGISWYHPPQFESVAEYDDFDLYVYGPSGQLVGSSTAEAAASSAGIASSAQVVNVDNAADGIYKIVVVPANIGDTNTYSGVAMVQSYAPVVPLGQPEPPLLQPFAPTNFQIQIGTDSLTRIGTDKASCYAEETAQDPGNPTRCLRFDAVIGNVGLGPFHLQFDLNQFATNPAVCPTQAKGVQQLVDVAGGPPQVFQAGTYCWHAAHGHVHYHDFATYGLYSVKPDGSVGALVQPAQKQDFCMIDVDDLWFGLPGNGARMHHFPTCDAPSRTDAAGRAFMDQGIERGWADNYTWDLPGQYIDITKVPDGEYYVGILMNPSKVIVQGYLDSKTGRVVEDPNIQNTAFTKIRLSAGKVGCDPGPCPPR